MTNKYNSDKLYVINKLENGEDLNIVFMSHNAHWANVEMLADRYKNCKVQIFGRGTAYIEMAMVCSKWYDPVENYDLIILRDTNFDDYEFNKMKVLAHEISNKENKTVTIGYSYFNPDYEKVDWNQEHIIRIVKITNDEEIEDTIKVLNLIPIELVNYVLIKHDNIDISKVKKLEYD